MKPETLMAQALKERAEAERLHTSLSVLSPDLGRRLPADLPAALFGRILERLRAEANRQPVIAFVDSLGARNWQGRQQSVDRVGEGGGGVNEDFLSREELIDRIEAWLGDARPENEVGIAGREHAVIAAESGNLPIQVGEGDVLPPSDQVENGFAHGAENVGTAADGQDRKGAA